MTFGSVIFGDNQFLGVNHSDQAKAAKLHERFNDPDAILEVLSWAYDAGVRDFMFTAHDRYEAVFDEVRRSRLFPEMRYSPCIPYAHKYWNKLSSDGVTALAASTILTINPLSATAAAMDLLRRRVDRFIHLLAAVEIQMCKGLRVHAVFLQNLAFDFIVAMELYREIEGFADAVGRRLGVTPGFITMNHPRAVSVLCDEIGLNRPWVCANYNLSGFRMNPSPEACESSFASGRTRNIAMSVLSAGRLAPSDALDFAVARRERGDFESILFGSSSRENIVKNMSVLTG